MNENKGKRGRPRLYLTIERFEKWLSNDFYHLKLEVRMIKWLTVTILAVLIGTLVVRFLIG